MHRKGERSAYTFGETTIWGTLDRVGGITPEATIRQSNGELLTIIVSKDLAQELGKFLYRDIGIEGEACWQLADWKIISFKGLAMAAYRPDETSLTRTMKELARASEGRWDGVDAAEFVRKLRHEDKV
jgi:hypothetical protein